jgi:predicted ATPase
MKISRVHLAHFKRFTDLTIRGLGERVRLVVLAGPNGSGKSSLFEGFMLWHRAQWAGWNEDHAYYRKGNASEASTPQRITLEFFGQTPQGEKAASAFYFRTAYRNDPEFQLQAIERQGPILGERRFNRMIESDAAVSINYRRLASQAFEDAFATLPAEMTLGEFREQAIGELRVSVQRLFPNLVLNTLGNPIQNGTFRFNKGTTEAFDYKNLSGGEKAAFDLILDLVVKRRALPEAIYCIDEPDAHMNASLQSALLDELLTLLPPDSQLWVATHSIGMMRKARGLAESASGTVAFLDFGDLNFDQPQTIVPSQPTRAFWQKQLGVALDDLAHLLAPREVFICEGNPACAVSGKDPGFDATCYDTIFADQYPDVAFLSAGNASDVVSDRLGFGAALRKVVAGIAIRRIIDRDDHAPADVAKYKTEGTRVLSRRNIESYLWSDEILALLCEAEGKVAELPQVLVAKTQAITNSVGRGNAADDIKKAAGELYDSLKRILRLVGRGNDNRAFARSTLAPLIRPGTDTYDALRVDIFG